MKIFYLFLITLSNAKAFPQEQGTSQMMSKMKDCFFKPDGSMADMESISACTARLEEIAQKALNHPGISDPGESQEGHLIALFFIVINH